MQPKQKTQEMDQTLDAILKPRAGIIYNFLFSISTTKLLWYILYHWSIQYLSFLAFCRNCENWTINKDFTSTMIIWPCIFTCKFSVRWSCENANHAIYHTKHLQMCPQNVCVPSLNGQSSRDNLTCAWSYRRWIVSLLSEIHSEYIDIKSYDPSSTKTNANGATNNITGNKSTDSYVSHLLQTFSNQFAINWPWPSLKSHHHHHHHHHH